MTAVLSSTRSPHRTGGYTPDQSESEDYISTLHYVSDTDTEGYSGNPASPLILGQYQHQQAMDTSISIRGLFDEDQSSATTTTTTTTAGAHQSNGNISRGRWGEPGNRNGVSVPAMRAPTNVVQDRERAQLSLVALLLATVRKSVLTLCQAVEDAEDSSLEIGWPTDVQHVAHVTFDRYNGFLGLPQEFEVEVPGRVPSASQSVFGVSAESMQCSYDRKGNSVPTILLLMQERLYHQGGLKAEGIFRINAENSHHEHVRDQLNKGVVPMDIDLHCLAGLIKAWFRELPQGVLDVLTPEQVLECHTEDETVALVKLLPPTQAALLDWAINLMADVVQEEAINKMNARNIAMVFAPNMTQMADPLTALMHAVQVMNLLKTLILRTLKDRQEAVLEQQQGATGPETSEGDEPDCDCNNVLLNGHERHSSGMQEDMKVDYDQYSHRIVIPTKRSTKVKAKNGRLECKVEATSERQGRLSWFNACRPFWSITYPLSIYHLLKLSQTPAGVKAFRYCAGTITLLLIFSFGFKLLLFVSTLALIVTLAG